MGCKTDEKLQFFKYIDVTGVKNLFALEMAQVLKPKTNIKYKTLTHKDITRLSIPR